MLTRELEQILSDSVDEAVKQNHEFVTVEHLLFSLLKDETAQDIIKSCGGNIKLLKNDIVKYFNTTLESIPTEFKQLPELTDSFQAIIQNALLQAEGSGQEKVGVGNILSSIFYMESSYAVYLLEKQGISRLDVLNYISHGISKKAVNEISSSGESFSKSGDTKETNYLESFTTELVAKAKEGIIDMIIGRDKEIERTIQILCRRKKNNPLYVGEPGVGKTALAEGIALKIALGNVPNVISDIEIYALDMGAVLAGTRYRGDFEQRFKGIIKELGKKDNAVLFIDEIHTIVGAGAVSGGALDASNILKPALASGRLRCIGSTTYSEYKSAFERDRALARRFQKIDIDEPTVSETYEILKGLKKYYEDHHNVRYTDESLKTAAELAGKYINDKFLPDKAIDVIDEVGALTKFLSTENTPKTITVIMVEHTVARMAKIPPKTVVADEKNRLKSLHSDLEKVIFGQNEAVTKVVQAIQISRAGLGHDAKPVGCFLFTGPTGVGKTELSKQLAKNLGIEFLRFDMSEYAESHTVSRLIGAPPGYVGFDQGGLLTDAIMRHPHSVLVLDEIEKAHPNLFNLLLQVMDSATLTDNNGKKADFRNVILIMTTNAGAREISSGGIGFQNSAETKGVARGAIEKTFAPEFLNRLDARVAFKPLDITIIKSIVRKFIDELNIQLTEKKVIIELSVEAHNWLSVNGFDGKYGARPMQRLIQEKIKKTLAEQILFGKLSFGGRVLIEVENNDLSFNFSKNSLSVT